MQRTKLHGAGKNNAINFQIENRIPVQEFGIGHPQSPIPLSDRYIYCRTKFGGRCLMALMTWSGKYSVGVEELDNQHRAFMKALNDLHAAAMRGQANVVAGPLIRQIISIAHEHFAEEEKYMKSIRFPGLATHRDKHEELTVKFMEMVSRHEKGDTTVYTQLLYFMRDWLTRHMQSEDQEYAAWISAHHVQSSAR